MLSIRMRRAGSKKRPFYRVVVAEGRQPREGAFKEILGTYNPRTKPAKVEVDRERLTHWIKNGARPSDTVRTLVARHLTRDKSIPLEPVVTEPTAPAAARPAAGSAPAAQPAAAATTTEKSAAQTPPPAGNSAPAAADVTASEATEVPGDLPADTDRKET